MFEQSGWQDYFDHLQLPQLCTRRKKPYNIQVKGNLASTLPDNYIRVVVVGRLHSAITGYCASLTHFPYSYKYGKIILLYSCL